MISLLLLFVYGINADPRFHGRVESETASACKMGTEIERANTQILAGQVLTHSHNTLNSIFGRGQIDRSVFKSKYFVNIFR